MNWILPSCNTCDQNRATVERLLALGAKRQLREFQDGLPFIRAKRDPTPQNIGAWRTHLMFQAGMPELRNDPRFVHLCARLGRVEF
jgi:hypothetical protein